MRRFLKWFTGVFVALVALVILGQAFSKDVTLTATAPTQYTDDSAVTTPLTIAFYYGVNGATPTLLNTVEDVAPGATISYVHTDRGMGVHTYYATALTADGIESAASNTASKTFVATRPPILQVN